MSQKSARQSCELSLQVGAFGDVRLVYLAGMVRVWAGSLSYEQWQDTEAQGGAGRNSKEISEEVMVA
jgi:hypothetical protein